MELYSSAWYLNPVLQLEYMPFEQPEEFFSLNFLNRTIIKNQRIILCGEMQHTLLTRRRLCFVV